MPEPSKPEFAIVTAMAQENRAVLLMMDRMTKDYEHGYSLGVTRPEFGLFEVIVQSHVRGRKEAYDETLRLLTRFESIKTVIFLGVSGANPQRKYGSKLEIHDVAVPRVIQAYDDVNKPPPLDQPPELLRLAEQLATHVSSDSPLRKPGLWETAIRHFRFDPTISGSDILNIEIEKPIKLMTEGTLGTFLEPQDDPEKRPDVDLADQEGYDILNAVLGAAKSSRRDSLVIRGISDHMDRKKLLREGKLSQKEDLDNQELASRTAAAVCGLLMGMIGRRGFLTPEMLAQGKEKYDPLDSLSWKGNRDDVPLVLPESFVNPGWSSHFPSRNFLIALINSFELGYEGDSPILRVSLDQDPLVIYNTGGKDFLQSNYVDRLFKDYKSVQDEASRFLKERKRKPSQFYLGEPGSSTYHPMRWASAGGLGIMNYKGDKWLVLFHRDRTPFGWNIPNGGSENEAEWTGVGRLAEREFMEEVMLVKECLSQGSRVCHQIYISTQGDPEWQSRAHQFTAVARNIRLNEDKLTVVPIDNEDQEAPAGRVRSPKAFKVDVSRRGQEGNDHWPHSDFVVSINAFELGMEATRVFTIDMDKCGANYILDGERSRDGRSLLRCPTILLKLESVRGMWERENSFESLRLPPDQSVNPLLRQTDCVQLDPLRGRIAADQAAKSDYAGCDFVYFDYDLPRLRENDSRRNGFQAILNSKHDGMIEVVDTRFRVLCPAVWRTLDFAFAQRMI